MKSKKTMMTAGNLRQAGLLQPADNSFQQIGDYDAGEHGREPFAQADDDCKANDQKQAENDDLGIGK